MQKTFLIAALTLRASTGLGHPNGDYEIDENHDATVNLEKLYECPELDGALSGKIRRFEFSQAAEQQPYHFVTGFYVETFVSRNGKMTEIYVGTDENCLPLDPAIEIEAVRGKYNGFPLKKIH